MTQQYLRKATLTITGATSKIDLSQLQFKFRILRGDVQTPNQADIRIYNVADATADAVQREYKSVTVQAGYEGSFGVIFQGNIKQVRRGRENATDTYLDITAADGDGAYNFAVVNTTLKAGSKTSNQIAALAKCMGPFNVTQGNVTGLIDQALPRAKVLFGMARDHLRNIANTSQTSWSIQDGKLNLVPLNNFVPNETVVITAKTGMIGLPEQTLEGIKVRTLLNPNIKIGGSIKIDNKSIQRFRFGVDQGSAVANLALNQAIHVSADGLYKVLWVDYQGDTRGQEWYSDIVCVAIDAVLGPDRIKKTTVLGAPNSLPPVEPYAPGDKFHG